jgi:hypothetical protein
MLYFLVIYDAQLDKTQLRTYDNYDKCKNIFMTLIEQERYTFIDKDKVFTSKGRHIWISTHLLHEQGEQEYYTFFPSEILLLVLLAT